MSLNKIWLHQGEYEWVGTGGLIRNDGFTIIHLLFKSINPSTRIVVYNLKYEIEKSFLAKFRNNSKDRLDEM